ncbi:NmrA family NAD(P)-binding protein [Streptomyces sp. NPDC101234]|uniref:NmrA family NAD(P)-binding protein n=1 Tax=Streptomyces sp. NPDC101234 TaxID=3366138 RepID=UPI00381AB482
MAFGPTGSDAEREFTRGRALVDAAAAVGVEHVVFTGIASTPGRPGGSKGKERIVDYLREQIRSVTVLRPVRFMSNYLGRRPSVSTASPTACTRTSSRRTNLPRSSR